MTFTHVCDTCILVVACREEYGLWTVGQSWKLSLISPETVSFFHHPQTAQVVFTLSSDTTLQQRCHIAHYIRCRSMDFLSSPGISQHSGLRIRLALSCPVPRWLLTSQKRNAAASVDGVFRAATSSPGLPYVSYQIFKGSSSGLWWTSPQRTPWPKKRRPCSSKDFCARMAFCRKTELVVSARCVELLGNLALSHSSFVAGRTCSRWCGCSCGWIRRRSCSSSKADKRLRSESARSVTKSKRDLDRRKNSDARRLLRFRLGASLSISWAIVTWCLVLIVFDSSLRANQCQVHHISTECASCAPRKEQFALRNPSVQTSRRLPLKATCDLFLQCGRRIKVASATTDIIQAVRSTCQGCRCTDRVPSWPRGLVFMLRVQPALWFDQLRVQSTTRILPCGRFTSRAQLTVWSFKSMLRVQLQCVDLAAWLRIHVAGATIFVFRLFKDTCVIHNTQLAVWRIHVAGATDWAVFQNLCCGCKQSVWTSPCGRVFMLLVQPNKFCRWEPRRQPTVRSNAPGAVKVSAACRLAKDSCCTSNKTPNQWWMFPVVVVWAARSSVHGLFLFWQNGACSASHSLSTLSSVCFPFTRRVFSCPARLAVWGRLTVCDRATPSISQCLKYVCVIVAFRSLISSRAILWRCLVSWLWQMRRFPPRRRWMLFFLRTFWSVQAFPQKLSWHFGSRRSWTSNSAVDDTRAELKETCKEMFGVDMAKCGSPQKRKDSRSVNPSEGQSACSHTGPPATYPVHGLWHGFVGRAVQAKIRRDDSRCKTHVSELPRSVRGTPAWRPLMQNDLHVHLHVNLHLQLHVHLHVCTFAHLHICTFVYLNICTFVHLYICWLYIYVQHLHSYIWYFLYICFFSKYCCTFYIFYKFF